MTRKALWTKGSALLIAGGLATAVMGCPAGNDDRAAEAPGDTQAATANMVYYAMPG